MIFDRIMLPAQGRSEDYKFAQTGSVTLAASVGGAGGAVPTPSWLESAIKLDPDSGFLSVDDWHVKGDLIIEGQVNQWFAQQLVVDDARIQVNRKQDGAVVDSGLVIFDKDTSTEVSRLVYAADDNRWKLDTKNIATEYWVENSATAYNAARLGGYAASNYPRKAENAVITGNWTFANSLNGNLGIGITPTERLHVDGNGLFTGGLTAGGNVSAPTFVSGFAGSGWRLEAGAENHLTIDRLTVRGRMDVYELAVNQIRGTNGAQWVSDSAKVASVSGNRLFIDTGGDTSFVPFVVNDLLRCQRWNGNNIKYYVVRVTAVGSNYIDVVLVDGSSPREAGDYLVRMGNTEDTDRQGALYLTSSDNNAPYMDVLDGVNSASFAGKTKVRIGRLDGITDPDLGTLSGYGLYTENGYFKGKIQVTGGNAATKEDLDAIQMGGKNLLIGSKKYSLSNPLFAGSTATDSGMDENFWVLTIGTAYLQVNIPSIITVGEEFTFSFIHTRRTTSEQVYQVSYGAENKTFVSNSDITKSSFTFTKTTDTYLRISRVLGGSGWTFRVDEFQLERGTEATDWAPAAEDVEYLAKAIHGSTEIEGGLINTNVLMVKDTNGAVRGGISGLASDNVGFWTGGTYQAAINDNANVIFRKDGSFSLAGGKITGTSDGALSVDAGVITGVIESSNYDGTVGSRFDLYNGHLLIGDAIRISGDVSEIQVKNRDTGLDSFRIGDFPLTPTHYVGTGIDVLLSSSPATTSASDGSYQINQTVYVSSSGAFSTSTSYISNSLIVGGTYNFYTYLKVTFSRHHQVETLPFVTEEFTRLRSGNGIKMQLKNYNTVIWERNIRAIPEDGVIPLAISTSFQAVSPSLQLIITIDGEYQFYEPRPFDSETRIYNTSASIERFNSSSRLTLRALTSRMEFSTKGMQTVFSDANYFRCDNTAIEGRGIQTFISPNGVYRLRISNDGIEKSTNSGYSWTSI